MSSVHRDFSWSDHWPIWSWILVPSGHCCYPQSCSIPGRSQPSLSPSWWQRRHRGKGRPIPQPTSRSSVLLLWVGVRKMGPILWGHTAHLFTSRLPMRSPSHWSKKGRTQGKPILKDHHGQGLTVSPVASASGASGWSGDREAVLSSLLSHSPPGFGDCLHDSWPFPLKVLDFENQKLIIDFCFFSLLFAVISALRHECGPINCHFLLWFVSTGKSGFWEGKEATPGVEGNNR